MVRLRKNNKVNFTIVPNRIIADERLTWKARGIFNYLYSMNDDWQFYETELAKHSMKDGRDSFRSGIAELEKYGYLKRNRVRNEKGQLTSSEWVISDEPMS